MAREGCPLLAPTVDQRYIDQVRALPLLALATACATSSPARQADIEDLWSRPAARPPPPVHRTFLRPASTSVAPRPFDRQAVELTLLEFVSKRRAIASTVQEWPGPMQQTWETFLTTLTSILEAPEGTVPRRVLIQVRVMVDVEMELSERRLGKAPPELTQRVQRVFVQVSRHLRAKQPDLEPQERPPLALVPPTAPLVVTSAFGYRRDPILGHGEIRFHAGVDLGGRSGDLVTAAAPGFVSSAGWTGGHGRTVVVQHPGGWVTMYAHLDKILVSPGASVNTGDPVGLVGKSGRSTGPHLHFEVRRGGVPYDPMGFLGATDALDLGAARP